MTIQQFISDKRNAREHSREAIEWFVSQVVSNGVTDYQISAWLMACYLNGLSNDETVQLTLAMANSGQRLDLSDLPGPIVDKHSTGGVGDAVTIGLLPLIAACGLTMVKMSGRGLGFTGGTIDKLESVPGFRTDLSMDELKRIAARVGCSLSAQTVELAPADKIFYALRDATATIDCIPLIAASVMSKKLAANADVIVLDVKYGNGAFMKTRERATELADTMVMIGNGAGKKVKAILSEMNQPLSNFVGNSLEVIAAIECLKDEFSGRLGDAIKEIANCAIELSEVSVDLEKVIQSGKPIEKCKEWIEAQGGDASIVENPRKLMSDSVAISTIQSEKSGELNWFDTAGIGEAVRDLGGGRTKKNEPIDHRVGIEILKSLGDSVIPGDEIFKVYGDVNRCPNLRNCFRID